MMNRFETYFDAFYAYYRNSPISKTLGLFENLGFVIMSTRENIPLIARAPCHFRTNFRILETDFSRIRYQHKQIPKKPFNILSAVIILIIC